LEGVRGRRVPGRVAGDGGGGDADGLGGALGAALSSGMGFSGEERGLRPPFIQGGVSLC
jgi:hypothetical protein